MGRRAAHHVTWSSRLEEYHPGPSSTVINQPDTRRVQQQSSTTTTTTLASNTVLKKEIDDSVKCVVVKYWTVEMGEVKVATVEGGGTGGGGGGDTGGGGRGGQQTPQELLIDNMATLPVGAARQQQHAIDISPERNNFTNKEMEAKKSGRSSANPSTQYQQQPKRRCSFYLPILACFA
ncbi:hypothetical protein O3M35_006530 [Rhynocoris fuscipes]|uniref:Uncharacterized protein n=1 Tax=Rhynocoris fuscipes TaxID=488301 RepID=A0AAW1DDR2_9HEMI